MIARNIIPRKLLISLGAFASITTYSQAIAIGISSNPLCYTNSACTEPPCKQIEAKAKLVAQEMYNEYEQAENDIAQKYKDDIITEREKIKDLSIEIDRLVAKIELLERDNLLTIREIIRENQKTNMLEDNFFFNQTTKQKTKKGKSNEK